MLRGSLRLPCVPSMFHDDQNEPNSPVVCPVAPLHVIGCVHVRLIKFNEVCGLCSIVSESYVFEFVCLRSRRA